MNMDYILDINNGLFVRCNVFFFTFLKKALIVRHKLKYFKWNDLCRIYFKRFHLKKNCVYVLWWWGR